MKSINTVLLIFFAVTSLSAHSPNQCGAYDTGAYANFFAEILLKDKVQVRAKIDGVFNQLFYGNDSAQRLYCPTGDDMAYIKNKKPVWFLINTFLTFDQWRFENDSLQPHNFL